jgi:hypothetical protein
MTWPFTHAQKQAIQAVDDKVPVMIKELEVLSKQLRDSIVSLPHINEDGSKVVHGCNMQCSRREDLIQHAINQLGYLLR